MAIFGSDDVDVVARFAISCCNSCSRIWTSWVRAAIRAALLLVETVAVCAEAAKGAARSARPAAESTSFLSIDNGTS